MSGTPQFSAPGVDLRQEVQEACGLFFFFLLHMLSIAEFISFQLSDHTAALHAKTKLHTLHEGQGWGVDAAAVVHSCSTKIY